MKIFIIGPEGSGKTVLLAMLGRFVATERKDLVLEPMDRDASKYVIAALVTLEKGDWPGSTIQAESHALQWRFGARGEPLHEIVIFDAAGQDLRKILLAEESLTKEQQSTRVQIDAADVLIYLLDLDGFLGSKELSLRDENAWLLKTFLTKPEWGCKQRLVVLSKADIYADMLAGETEGAKVREVVKQHLPENYSLAHLVDENAAVSYLAITSVATKTIFDQTGNPVRLPKIPLKSVGISNLIEALIKHARWLQFLKIAKNLAWVMAVLVALYVLFHKVDCRACAAKGTVACQVCSGSGKVTVSTSRQKACNKCNGTGAIGIVFKDRCKVCGGTGRLTDTVSQVTPCSACNSSGAIICPSCQGKKKVFWW